MRGKLGKGPAGTKCVCVFLVHCRSGELQTKKVCVSKRINLTEAAKNGREREKG